MHKGVSTRGGALGLLGLMIYRIFEIAYITRYNLSYEYNYHLKIFTS